MLLITSSRTNSIIAEKKHNGRFIALYVIKVTGPTAPELEKLTSLNLCYLGLLGSCSSSRISLLTKPSQMTHQGQIQKKRV